MNATWNIELRTFLKHVCAQLKVRFGYFPLRYLKMDTLNRKTGMIIYRGHYG